jgi:hypothetical protein
MQSALFLLSLVAVVILVAGAVVTVIGLRNAPEGYEDENGFQFTNPAPANTAAVAFPVLTEVRPVATAAYSPNYELAA